MTNEVLSSIIDFADEQSVNIEAWLSLVERCVRDAEVVGSNPVEVIQSLYFRADVAQLAEQLICNQQVIGSSPIIGFLDL